MNFLILPVFITVLSLAASVLFAMIGRYTYTGIFGLIAIVGFLDIICVARFWNVFQRKKHKPLLKS